MKQKIPVLFRRYLSALRADLRRPSLAGAAAARRLGHEFLANGHSALDLAKLHEQCLLELAATPEFKLLRLRRVRRAAYFFGAALTPIERAHRSSRALSQQLLARAEAMRQRTKALAMANRSLATEVARRRAGEAAILAAKERYHVLYDRSLLMEKKLRHLARQILAAQEEERREISRELHDEVVQTLVGINVQLAALGSAASIGMRALKAKIARTQKLVEKSVDAVHQFARELRPAVLDDLGLIPALEGYMKMIGSRKRLKISLIAFAGVEAMDTSRRTVLYRVAQEALTNVGRHAEADHVTVNISQIAGGVRMAIHDDGKSFLVPESLATNTNRRLGLLGMRERVEMVGGTLRIDSAPSRGTTVCAEIPFTTQKARR